MAKVKITGHASGTGILTVTAPNTSTDRTITLPDADVTLGAATPSITDGGNATAITIDAAEEVGIGTATPLAKLHVQVASQSESHTYVYDGTGMIVEDAEPNIQLIAADSGTHGGSVVWRYGDNTFAQIANPTDDSLDFHYGVSSADNFELHNTGTNVTSFKRILQIKADGRGLSQFTAKAWCNVDQGGQTLQDSHNISSISDVAVGKTLVNFDVDLANANYAVATSSEANSFQGTVNQAADSVQIYIENDASSYEDRDNVCMVVFGD